MSASKRSVHYHLLQELDCSVDDNEERIFTVTCTECKTREDVLLRGNQQRITKHCDTCRYSGVFERAAGDIGRAVPALQDANSGDDSIGVGIDYVEALASRCSVMHCVLL